MSTFYLQAGRMNDSLERVLLRQTQDKGEAFSTPSAFSGLKNGLRNAARYCAEFADEYRTVAHQANALSSSVNSRRYY